MNPLQPSESSIASAIMMKQDSNRKSFLIVEGDTDYRIFRKLRHNRECSIIIAGAKSFVIKAIKELDKRNFKAALAIVDADFEYLQGYIYESCNLLRTETCDMDALMLKTESLDTILTENTIREKIDKFTKTKDIRSILLKEGKKVGIFRYLGVNDKNPFSIKKLEFEKFVDIRTLEVNIQKLLGYLIKKYPKRQFDKENMLDRFNTENKKIDDPWLVCNGHDMVELLFIGYKHIFGMNVGQLSPEALSAMLRLSFNFDIFSKTILFNKIKLWERENKLCRIFCE